MNWTRGIPALGSLHAGGAGEEINSKQVSKLMRSLMTNARKKNKMMWSDLKSVILVIKSIAGSLDCLHQENF